MTDLLEVSEVIEQEIPKVSSQNHALVQLRLGSQLNLDDQFNAATELSLDVSATERQEILRKCKVKAERDLKPDVCLYYAEDFDYIEPAEDVDVLRVEKMPLLCVEIVSPTQSSHDIIPKFRAYFAMGVKSCWLVDPTLKTIVVYSSPTCSKFFGMTETEVVDTALPVRLLLDKVFFKKTRLAKYPAKASSP